MAGPPRRLKVVLMLVLLIILIAMYITSSGHSTRTSAFYTRTQDALATQRASKEESLGHTDHSPTVNKDDAQVDTHPTVGVGGMADDMRKGLKEAEEKAKAAADKKGDEFHGEAGREKAAQIGLKDAQEESNEEKKKAEPETEEQSRVKDELNSILKRSPGRLTYIFAVGSAGLCRRCRPTTG